MLSGSAAMAQEMMMKDGKMMMMKDVRPMAMDRDMKVAARARPPLSSESKAV